MMTSQGKVKTFRSVRTGKRGIPAVLAALLLALIAGCAPSQNNGSGGSSLGGGMTVEGLGNVKVWYRVYARSDVNTGTSDRSGFNVPRTARYQADIHDVLINTSHKGYENIDPVQLKTEEFLVPDNWMLALLQRLRELGYFNSSASGAVEIPMSPPDYVARLSKRPDKWIAVGHQGRYTLLAFNRDEFERDYKDHIPEYIRRKNEIYILSEEAVRSAKAHHLLKPIVGSGSGNPLGNQGRGSR